MSSSDIVILIYNVITVLALISLVCLLYNELFKNRGNRK